MFRVPLLLLLSIRHMLMVGHILVVGTLKGFDQLMNLVLDDVKEMLRGRIKRYG